MALADRNDVKTGKEARLVGLAVITIVLTISSVFNPGRIGVLISLIPLPVFYYLVLLGKKDGTLVIRNAILIAGGLAIITGALPQLVIPLSLLPLGFVFFHAAQEGKSPIEAGFHGILVLLAIWGIYWILTGLTQNINPYRALVENLDQMLVEAHGIYKESFESVNESGIEVEAAFENMRTAAPKILPGLLLSGVLYTVWMNLSLGNWLLRRKSADLAPWQEFNLWRLPDYLVWGGILGAISAILPTGQLQTIGINILLIWGVLYFLQGLAVLVCQLNKWALPRPLRLIIYLLLCIQAHGMLLLTFIGLIDVWADFRKISADKKNEIQE